MTVLGIEGPDGIGKSMLSKLFVARLDEEYPEAKIMHVELPSRYITGMAIKSIRAVGELDPKVASLLYAADHLHVWNMIKDKITKDTIVVTERSIVSYFIYQHLINKVDLTWLLKLNKYNGLTHDTIFILRTYDAEYLAKKCSHREFDVFETEEMLKKQINIFNAFEKYEHKFPNTDFIYIDIDDKTNDMIITEMMENVIF